jgi:hypothetical protein
MYVLRQNTVLTVVPIIAAVVYILAALADGLETAENKQVGEAIAEQEFDLEERRAKAEHERRLEAAELRLKHEAKIARIAAKSANVSAPQKTQSERRAPQKTYYECACGQVYDKPQSYSAHTRNCEAYRKLSENGHKEQVN